MILVASLSLVFGLTPESVHVSEHYKDHEKYHSLVMQSVDKRLCIPLPEPSMQIAMFELTVDIWITLWGSRAGGSAGSAEELFKSWWLLLDQ